MSKCLEFGPDQDFKPRKPQAVEISGSQLCFLHPAGDVEAEKDEKPSPKIPSRLLPFPPPLFSSSPAPSPECPSSNQGWNEDEELWGCSCWHLGLHSQRGRVITQPALLGLPGLPGGEKLQGELQRENRLKIRFGVSRRRSG